MFNARSFIILFRELRLAMGSGCNAEDVQATWVALAGQQDDVPPCVWGRLTAQHLETLVECLLFAEPCKESQCLFEPSTEVRVSGEINFSSIEKFCLLQFLAHCLGGTGWT